MKHLVAQLGLTLTSTCLGLGLIYLVIIECRDTHLVFGLKTCSYYYYFYYHYCYYYCYYYYNQHQVGMRPGWQHRLCPLITIVFRGVSDADSGTLTHYHADSA
jgi:hypothetical protein